MSDAFLSSETKDGIRTLTFTRPERKNALTVATYELLVAELKAAEADVDTRVVVVTGSGDSFTAGNDLHDFMNTPPAGEDSPVFQLLLAISTMEKPLVAAVNGTAIGVGVTMLLHCDLVYAAENALLQLPFVSLGVVPEGASSYLLPKVMGHARASELLLLGEKFGAKEAERLGLVTRVYPAAELAARVREKALVLAGKPTVSVKLAKALLKDADKATVRETLGREGALFLERLQSPAAVEAFTAFFEKRAPDFRSVGE